MKIVSSFKLFGLVALVALASSQVSALSQERQDAIAERLQPVGEVCVQGDDSCATAAAVSSEPRSAQEVYDASCFGCHGTGAAGAPKLGDKAAWADRIAKGTDELYNSGLNGLGAMMPPKGGCGSCSDDEIKSVVDLMIEQGK